MWIPIGLSYTTTVKGSVPKCVTCEGCSCEYVYFFKAWASGQGLSLLFADNQGARDRSLSAAEQCLMQTLQQGCQPVPCPSCGHVQEHMIPTARWQRRPWLRIVGIAFLIGAAAVALPAAIFTAVESGDRSYSTSTLVLQFLVGLLGLAGSGLLLYKLISGSRYNPNNEPVEDRLRMGKEFAIGLEQLSADEQAMIKGKRDQLAGLPPAELPDQPPRSRILEGVVYCTSCEQRFQTKAVDKCPLCGAHGSLIPG